MCIQFSGLSVRQTWSPLGFTPCRPVQCFFSGRGGIISRIQFCFSWMIRKLNVVSCGLHLLCFKLHWKEKLPSLEMLCLQFFLISLLSDKFVLFSIRLEMSAGIFLFHQHIKKDGQPHCFYLTVYLFLKDVVFGVNRCYLIDVKRTFLSTKSTFWVFDLLSLSLHLVQFSPPFIDCRTSSTNLPSSVSSGRTPKQEELEVRLCYVIAFIRFNFAAASVTTIRHGVTHGVLCEDAVGMLVD